MMPLLRIIAMLFTCMLALIGCREYEPVLPPDVRINPEPVERYRAVMKIVGINSYNNVTGQVGYSIVNRSHCVPIDPRRSLGGSRPSFNETISAPVTMVSENTYEIIFYDDAILGEDYYGKGVCNWSSSPGFRFIFSGVVFIVRQRGGIALGEELDKACRINVSGSIGNCMDADHFRNSSTESVFHVYITIYKDY